MVNDDEVESYKTKNLAMIKALLDGTGCRPVLFLGSGITRRYLGAPGWIGLLQAIATSAGITADRFNFLYQRSSGDLAKLGSELVTEIHEWAWATGKNSFPPEYFTPNVEKSIFLKHMAAEHLNSFDKLEASYEMQMETALLKKVAPHAIITTNFDTLCEILFPDYELVVGERIIPMSMNITGELYKIHGSVSDPATLVLTQNDYDIFIRKRRYISAKMMTYFAEYPVFIFGYGLGDQNVNAVISDLGEALKDKGGLLENVFYIEWVSDIKTLIHLKEEHVVAVNDGALPPLRVRTIVTDSFEWILKGLSDFASPVPINTKILRQFASRIVDLVRVEIPKNKIEIDYKKIEALGTGVDELAMLLGISKIVNPNIEYPHLISSVAPHVGYTSWQLMMPLVRKCNGILGYDIQKSDNNTNRPKH